MIQKDTPVLIISEDNKRYLTLFSQDKKLHTHLGVINFSEITHFGQKLLSSKGKTFFVLKPSIADTILKIKRKTTILYPKDMGFMLMNVISFDTKAVSEVGSGSGGLTVFLSMVLDKSIKIYSFERRKEFLELAKKNVLQLGVPERVEFVLRDVSKEGFGDFVFDALFVDVSEPWEIIPHAKISLSQGGALVSLSPNFEQVKKTVATLKENGFYVEKTVEIFEREILVREYGVRPKERMISHTGYITIAKKVE